MKVLTVIGARPQFIKACMLSKAFESLPAVKEVMVHTGQHYDDNMSKVFFEQLKLPKPDYYLGVGSDTHGIQTAKMLTELERVMLVEKPDIVLVYGDTNSTLAGALAAAKLHIPVAHVEAGLRSFNKKMPEEINRILTDHLSEWLFCPSRTALENLKREGIEKGVFETGDIMYDAIQFYKPYALQYSTIIPDLNLASKNYYLATVHRAENTDDPEKLRALLEAFHQMKHPVVFPMHPRTKHKIQQWKLNDLLLSENIKLVEPLNYFDMITVESQAKVILTDSGGVQKEAYMLGVPCITLREETEWVETVAAGWNQITGADADRIMEAEKNSKLPSDRPELFGDGSTSKQIMKILTETN
ncbi:non-hydrolyzing UDP-N-acetylglucosamine 2-epimerase [Mesobacillus foraminis]|uniref:UDP-GlcNAc3NAcA epimerase n=1 Tax=Mesobacillus foraminis TaxID=279826 RepID=A0A4R2BL95_9BACI|nr:UDP-N-acetylglucosamine 2-epimerase (non-hydrolyzing) [Mesobacillus foraminis]TCN27836.1 UDP-GlcNAc3NAcA epimerase [Mesobacillus foraminis]